MRRAAALAAVLLAGISLAEEAPRPVTADERAQCLKQCAGAPRDATGPALLACLSRCEAAAAAPDAGR